MHLCRTIWLGSRLCPFFHQTTRSMLESNTRPTSALDIGFYGLETSISIVRCQLLPLLDLLHALGGAHRQRRLVLPPRLSVIFVVCRAPAASDVRLATLRARTSASASRARAIVLIIPAGRFTSFAPGCLTAYWPQRPCHASSPYSPQRPMLPHISQASGAMIIKM